MEDGTTLKIENFRQKAQTTNFILFPKSWKSCVWLSLGVKLYMSFNSLNTRTNINMECCIIECTKFPLYQCPTISLVRHFCQKTFSFLFLKLLEKKLQSARGSSTENWKCNISPLILILTCKRDLQGVSLRSSQCAKESFTGCFSSPSKRNYKWIFLPFELTTAREEDTCEWQTWAGLSKVRCALQSAAKTLSLSFLHLDLCCYHVTFSTNFIPECKLFIKFNLKKVQFL